MIFVWTGPASVNLDGRDAMVGPLLIPDATYTYVLPIDTVPLPADAGNKSGFLGYLLRQGSGSVMLGPSIVAGVAGPTYSLPNDTVPLPSAAGGKSVPLGHVQWASGNRGLLRGVVEVGGGAVWTLPAGGGIFAWGGFGAELGATRRLLPAAGTFGWTGRDAVLLVSPTPLAAGGASFLLTGGAAGLLVTRRLAAESGPFALTGLPAAMEASTLILLAGRGAFVESGVSAGLTHGYLLSPAAGGFGLNVPGLSFGSLFSRGRDTQLFHRSAGGDYWIGVGGNVMTVQVDIIEGSAATHHIAQGWAITRVAVITGLNVAANDDTAALYQEGLNALIAVVGDRGSQCPSISVPTYLEEFIPELLSAEAVKIRMVYKGYPLPTYEFDGSLSQVESNLDANGSPIVVGYTYPDDYALDPRKAGQYIRQGGMVSRAIPEPVFTVRFIVTAGTIPPVTINGTTWLFEGVQSATNVMCYLKAYEGLTNAAPYSLGLFTGQAHQWLIEKVRGVSRDGGLSYEASMTFHLRYQTWDQLVTFINPDDGKPPPDIVHGTGPATPTSEVGYYLARVPPEGPFPIFAFGPN